MAKNPIRGKTLLFHFVDGIMANKTFEHRFADDGTVTFRMVMEGKASSAPTPGGSIRYEVAPIRDDVCAVSYPSKGYTLTTILDFESMKLVAFSSNEKTVSIQHGTFETSDTCTSETKARGNAAHPH